MRDSASNAKRYALRLLSYRARSEKELRERLDVKGFSENEVLRAVRELKQAGYVDDKVLACDLKRQVQEKKLFGYGGAKAFMLKRGLSEDVVGSVIAYDEDSEIENALRLIRRRRRSQGNRETAGERRRLWNFLARRGYSFDVIGKAFKRIYSNEEAE